MGRGADPGCDKDALTVLDFIEQTERYRVVQDRLPSLSNAAAMRPKRSCRARHMRTTATTEDKRALRLQHVVRLRHNSSRVTGRRGADAQTLVQPSQGSQSSEGDSNIDLELDTTVEMERVQITVCPSEHPIIMPAPGAVQVGRRRDVSKADLDEAEALQPTTKRSRKQQVERAGQAPVGIPNPVNAVVASGAPIFQVLQDQAMDDAHNEDHDAAPHIMTADIQDFHQDHMAEVPAHDPFAQLSLPALNEILEKRLSQRLVPEFQPHEGNSTMATAKQFQREILQNRVEHFRAILKQTTLLMSAHAQIAASLSSLGDPERFSAAAKAQLKEDQPALLAFKKLCKKAPKLAEQQVKFAAVMKEFDAATNQHAAAEQDERQLYTRQEMEAGMTRAADEREAQVRKEFEARAAAAPEPADPAMLPLAADIVAAHSTNDRERDAAIQAIAYTLAPSHRLADMAANIEDMIFDCYNENGKAGDKYWTRLKALVTKMCPQNYGTIWERTFGTSGSHGTATDASSASATGHSAADAIDLGNTAQQLEALQTELVAADSTRGKLWEGSMPIAAFATGS